MDKAFQDKFVFHARKAAEAMEKGDMREAAYHMFQAAHCFAMTSPSPLARYAAERAADFMRDVMECF